MLTSTVHDSCTSASPGLLVQAPSPTPMGERDGQGLRTSKFVFASPWLCASLSVILSGLQLLHVNSGGWGWMTSGALGFFHSDILDITSRNVLTLVFLLTKEKSPYCQFPFVFLKIKSLKQHCKAP